MASKTKATVKKALTRKLGHAPTLEDVHHEMGLHLSKACGARVEVLTPGPRHSMVIMAASPAARDEATNVLRLAGHAIESAEDVPVDADEPDYPAGQFWAWYVEAA